MTLLKKTLLAGLAAAAPLSFGLAADDTVRTSGMTVDQSTMSQHEDATTVTDSSGTHRMHHKHTMKKQMHKTTTGSSGTSGMERDNTVPTSETTAPPESPPRTAP